MKRSDSEKFLDELLAGDDQTHFRQKTLSHGLAALRRRGHRQRLARVCGALAACCLLALGFVLVRAHDCADSQAGNLARSAPAPAAELPPIKIINDEELFALFPNRALALVGQPGHQQLVFLDHPATTRTE